MIKRKLKLVKVVHPELVAYICHHEEILPDYRCAEGGFGVADDYNFCPYCGSELDFSEMNELSQDFKDFIDKL